MLNRSNALQDILASLPSHLLERARWYSLGGESADGKLELSLPSNAPSIAPVVYWTHHALRTDENPALDAARYLAVFLNAPLLVYQGVSENYRFASDRHHWFSLQGAVDLAQQYGKLGIRHALHVDRRDYRVPALKRITAMARVLITDEFPGEPTDVWLERLRGTSATPILTVDTSCVVPMLKIGRAFDRAFAYKDATRKWYKERVGAPWPACEANPLPWDQELPFVPIDTPSIDLAELVSQCEIDHSIGPVLDTPGGTTAGYARWEHYCRTKLSKYAKLRNDPTSEVASRMSAYLHYGMVSPMRLARDAHERNAEKYLEELLIWREMAYCYCFYRDDYDTLDTLPDWATQTLAEHEADRRDQLFAWEDLARGKTSDRLWNACQRSLVKHGELHNNVRMTWGKAILHWTRNAGDALRQLIDLNHRYALDGRDPASYGGILWCLGQFDRPFHPSQPVLGTVRSRPTSEHAERLDLTKYESQIDRFRLGAAPRVAMVGAGLGGLMAARILSDHGWDVTVFDKSRGPGGRASTRRLEQMLQFDHGAQYFTCKDPRVAKYVCSWIEMGLVGVWTGRIVEWRGGAMAAEKSNAHRMVWIPGMNAMGKHLAKDLPVQYQRRVDRIEGEPGAYRVAGSIGSSMIEDERFESDTFDSVLINCPAHQTLQLMPSQMDSAKKLQHASHRPCWTVMVAFGTKWELPFDGAFVKDSPIAWIARDSSKPSRPSELDCWVLQTSSDWAAQNLQLDRDTVCDVLVQELNRLFPTAPPEPLFRQSHRWLYAAVERGITNEPCYWDPQHRIGACGDWFQTPNIEGALLSGMALAGRVMGTVATGVIANFSSPSLQIDAPQQLKLF
jgi:photolyase PhrII